MIIGILKLDSEGPRHQEPFYQIVKPKSRITAIQVQIRHNGRMRGGCFAAWLLWEKAGPHPVKRTSSVSRNGDSNRGGRIDEEFREEKLLLAIRWDSILNTGE
jgi:hypothetical protein